MLFVTFVTDPDTHSAHEEKNSPESTSFQSPTISSVSKSNTSFLLELPDYFKEKSVQDSFQPSYTKLSPVSMSGESSLHKSANNSLHLNNSHAMKVNHFHYFHAKIPPNIYIHLGNMAHGVLYRLKQDHIVRRINIDNFLEKYCEWYVFCLIQAFNWIFSLIESVDYHNMQWYKNTTLLYFTLWIKINS